MSNTLIKHGLHELDTPIRYSEGVCLDNKLLTRRSYKIKVLVDALRLVSEDVDISKEHIVIPDECERYGFVEGNHDLGILLQFLAAMLEE